MFDLERKKASFNILQLSHFIYGSKEKFQQFQAVLHVLQTDPILKYDPTFLHQSRADMMTTYAKKMIRFHSLYPLDGTNEVLKNGLFCHTPTTMHGSMFLTTLRNLCDQQQEKIYLQPALRGEILGCYVQTQLAHGSDVQNILTTATYDPSNETFVINTPQVAATKWWIGNLGLYANHAAVYAQLIIDGKRYGVHVFMVVLRDKSTLQPVRGIEIGDIGPKLGFQTTDNGYAIFNNVRIPRRNMLMKYHVVSKDGKYSLQGDQKISYAIMLMTRSNITQVLSFGSSKIATIGTRYSILRTQFKNSKDKKEIQIIDYQTQQQKIIPRIAESYAAWFTAKNIRDLSNYVFAEAKVGRFDRLQEAHILTSATKAILTQDGLRGGQIVRRSAGGHGFSSYNGIVPLIQEAKILYVGEGQFTILILQVGRFLIKSFDSLQKGKPLNETVQYYKQIKNGVFSVAIPNYESLSCPYLLQKILTLHSCGKMVSLMKKYGQLLSKKLTVKEIEDYHAGLLISDAAIAHTYVVIYNYFFNQVKRATNPKIKTVLTKLLLLYGIDKIIQRASKFYQTSTIAPESISLLFQKKQKLFEELRPQCLSLVQAFGYNDSILMSAIGASNGKPYENLIEWAQKYNTINRKEQRDQVITAIKKSKSQLKPRL